MQDLNDLYYFARVVEEGGFAAAGRALGIPKSRLSRRVLDLESRLGVRLLSRSTRKITLTDIGERYYRRCQAVLAAAEMAEETVAQWTAEPRGRVRLSCPVLLSQTTVGPLLPSFLAAHPRVQLELLLTNRRVDLVEEGVDVALRVRERGDEEASLVARRLRPTPSYLVGAPGLLAGEGIEAPEDLTRVPVLGAVGSDRRVHLRLVRTSGEVREIALEPRLGTEDFALRKRAALEGLGVTLLPRDACAAELERGALVRVLPEWCAPEAHLVIVYPHRRGLLPAVRALIDHLSGALAE